MPVAPAFVVMPLAVAPAPLPVPAMVVLEPPPLAFPITREVLTAFIPRTNPSRAGVRRPRPISFVPSVATTHRIPVAIYPRETRTGSSRPYGDHPRRWRRTDADTEGNLTEYGARGQKGEYKEFLFHALYYCKRVASVIRLTE
jgi:hypothetical protein